MSFLRPSHRPGRARGRGGAMGDVGYATVADLAAQVNRFGPGAPAAYQFATTPFPPSSVLDPALALTAITIYLRRATDAYNQFHDAASAAAIDKANKGFADPTTFVQANLYDVTSTIGMFADAAGLPAAAGSGVDTGISPLLLGGVGLGILFLMKGKKR